MVDKEIRIIDVGREDRSVNAPGKGRGHGHHVPGGIAYRLTAEPTTYSIVGADATLSRVVNRRLTATTPATYLLGGTPATLIHTLLIPKALVVGSASYLFSGHDATLARVVIPKVLTVGSGSYLLNGTPATLKPTVAARVLIAGSASYLLNGTPATLVRVVIPKVLAAGSASYLLNGKPATLTRVVIPKIVVAGSAAYALNGSSALLSRTSTVKFLAASPSTYAFTGSTATRFLKGRKVVAGGSSYAFTGKPVVIAKSLKKIDAGTSSYVFTGTNAVVKRGKKLVAGVTSYAFVGAANSFKRGKRLTAASATYTFSGKPATLSTNSIALTPLNMLGQQVHRAWFQEDLPTGAVASWLSVGRAPLAMTQSTVASQPTKLAGNGGVYFQAAATKFLQSPTNFEAPFSHRWWVVIARANLTAASGDPLVFTINGNQGAQTQRQPAVSFTNSTNTMNSAMWDTASRTLSGACSTAFTDWNILIGYRRGFKHLARINGGTTQSTDFLSWRINNVSSICTFGSGTGTMPVDMAIDSIILGDGELTDYMVEALEGWAAWRVGRQSLLTLGPSGATHAFKNAAPTTANFGSADRHSVFQFDQAAWDTFIAGTNTIRFTHRGEQTYSETGYKRVFFTDFDLPEQKPVSDLLGSANSPWFAPGWNDASGVGGLASLRQSSGQPYPLAYTQNVASPGTMSMHMYNDGSWKSGAFTSVNHQGIGRCFGKGIFKVKLKYTGTPALVAPFPGFFPGPLWTYVIEHLMQRTRNRIEFDFIELTGAGGAWNEANLHIHEPQFVYPADPTAPATGPSKEFYGYNVRPATDPDFNFTLNVFDGSYHEWICKVEDDFTYFWVDGYELARCPTHASMTYPKYLYSNFALDAPGHGRLPAASEAFDMTFDYVEVMQKSTELAAVPTGFSGLPTISGTATVGSTLTVTPNTTSTQIEYRWYRDGVPLVTPMGATYQVVQADVGHKIRVQVKNKSRVNQPEAWTGETATVPSSAAGTKPTSPPVGATILTTSDNVTSIVNAAATGTTFYFSAGTYRGLSLAPKNSQVFIGAQGAIINGSALLTNWFQSNALWAHDGQTQQGLVHPSAVFLPGTQRPGFPETLFIDNVPLRPVDALAKVVAGTFFLDYNLDRIYIATNPAGHTIEAGKLADAFHGSATNVTVKNLVVEKYDPQIQDGAINAGVGWIVQDCEARLNYAVGISMRGNGGHIIGCYVHDNGEMGLQGGSFSGVSTGILVEDNELAWNGYWSFIDPLWEGGGCKFVSTDGIIFRANFAHDNKGTGLWTDIDNINSLYEENVLSRNTINGISHEISFAAIIRNNVFWGNGFGDTRGWGFGADCNLQTSKNVQVYGNRIEATGGHNPLVMVQQSRGSGIYGTYAASGNNIHDNIVVNHDATGSVGGFSDFNNTAMTAGGNIWLANSYYMTDSSSRFEWAGNKTFAQFVAATGETGTRSTSYPDTSGWPTST